MGRGDRKYCILKTPIKHGESLSKKEEVDSQVPRNRARSENPKHQLQHKTKRHGNRHVDELSNMDNVVTSAKPCQFKAQLYIFEDTEAVIKMIIKGRSPTMRHVSRNDRVALDWLFDKINLDPQIQIKCVENKNQLANMLIKGSSTSDEWNHLLRFFTP